MLMILLYCRNFLSQLDDERTDTESRLEKMSRDMEGVYQTKVAEKMQKLEESKQNVSENLTIELALTLVLIGFENTGNVSIECSTRRRTFTIETRRI